MGRERENRAQEPEGWGGGVGVGGREWRLQDVLGRPAGVHLEPEGTFQLPSDWGDGKKSRPILEWKMKADSSGTIPFLYGGHADPDQAFYSSLTCPQPDLLTRIQQQYPHGV